MKPDLVSADFLFTFGFTFEKHTGWDRYFQLTLKIQRIYQVFFDSSNHQHGIRVSYDMIRDEASTKKKYLSKYWVLTVLKVLE